MIGDNWCVSCARVIPTHQFFRSWCDACIEELRKKFERSGAEKR